MGGSEYRKTANKIELTPYHSKILPKHRHRDISLSILMFWFHSSLPHACLWLADSACDGGPGFKLNITQYY